MAFKNSDRNRLFFIICGAEEERRVQTVLCTCLNMDLYEAVSVGNQERIRSLIEQGINKDKENSDGWTPFRLASYYGHLDVLQYLVEQSASLEKANNVYGYTPLITAAYEGRLEIARYLLEQGADRDKADVSGWTPLHHAVQCRHLEIAMLLMSYGADLNARTRQGQLPIDMPYATEEIKQAIRDEPRRRMDEAPGKRATEQDRHPNAATSASAQEEEEENEEHQQSNKRPRLDEGAVVATGEETKVAEEDEDSEPSSDENDD